MNVNLYHGDCLDVMRDLPAGSVDAVVTDPPYPNNSGKFDDDVPFAREFLTTYRFPLQLVFWSKIEYPPIDMPLVAVHIWHRTNVNGKIYEPIYHFAEDGRKRRSEVIRGAAIFKGAGAGCNEYEGHPTQKPIHLMRCLIEKFTRPGDTILDPFMGSGTTGVACVKTGRNFIGIEKDAGYYNIAAKRIAEAQMQLPLLEVA